MMRLKTALSTFAAIAALAAPNADAQTLARWDFEDGDLVVDEADVANTGATLSTTDATPAFSGGDGSAQAVNLNSMNVLLTSSASFVVDTGGQEAQLSFAIRVSGSASKHWLVQADGGAGFNAIHAVLSLAPSTFTTVTATVPAPTSGTSSTVRILASDDIGDGTGNFVQADDVGTPSASGTVRLDDIEVSILQPEPDGGVVDGGTVVDGGIVDAGPVDAGPVFVPPFAVRELFFNAATGSDTGKEWIEVENVSDTAQNLDGWTLQTGRNQTFTLEYEVALSATPTLAPGELVVIAQSADLGEGVCPPGEVIVVGEEFKFEHDAGTQRLRLVAPGGDVIEVTYVSSAVNGDTNGKSLLPDTNAVSACEYVSGTFGSPGFDEADCLTALLDLTCPEDGGTPSPEPGVDGGEPDVQPDPEPDDNQAPSIEMTAPSSAVQGALLTLSYTASDPDGDVVDVALFYDTDGQGFDGVRIAEGLPGGSHDYSWTPQNVPAGVYRIFGRVTDVWGVTNYSYADGTVQVGEPTAEDATLVISEPDGTNDVDENNAVRIAFTANFPADAEGTVSLYYDTDQEGGDGEPIAAAIPVLPGEEVVVPWDLTGVEAGTYAVAGVLSWTRGTAEGYSEYVQVSAAACSCASTPTGGHPGRHLGQILLLCAMAAILVLPRRRIRRLQASAQPTLAPNHSSNG